MITTYLDIVLVVTGVYTAAAILQFFAPRLFLAKLTFGVETSDPFTLILAQHWALLAALVGGLLIYAASHPGVRGPVLVFAAIEKAGLATLILFGGWRRRPAATRMAVVDLLMALIFVGALAGL